jgi:hypothetical protein
MQVRGDIVDDLRQILQNKLACRCDRRWQGVLDQGQILANATGDVDDEGDSRVDCDSVEDSTSDIELLCPLLALGALDRHECVEVLRVFFVSGKEIKGFLVGSKGVLEQAVARATGVLVVGLLEVGGEGVEDFVRLLSAKVSARIW